MERVQPTSQVTQNHFFNSYTMNVDKKAFRLQLGRVSIKGVWNINDVKMANRGSYWTLRFYKVIDINFNICNLYLINYKEINGK